MRRRCVFIVFLSVITAAAPWTAALGGHPSGGTYQTNSRPNPTNGGRDTITIFVHGYANDGATDCAARFDTTKQRLREFGHTGAFYTVGYYAGDTNCNHDIGNHGQHGNHYSSGHTSANEHTVNTNIRHLGFHFAKYIWNQFSGASKGVQIVAHSMGGLIARYAMAQVEQAHPDFPIHLLVEDTVTVATPHDGAFYTCEGGSSCNTQREQMYPGHEFLEWLRANAWHPQPSGLQYTDWTGMGSYDDDVVSEHSAVEMGLDHKVLYWGGQFVCHPCLLTMTSDARSADVYYKNGSSYYAWQDAPWGVRWIDYALFHPTNW